MVDTGQGGEGGFSRILGMDTSADWLLGPALPDFLPPGAGEVLVPFLLRVDDPDALAVVRSLVEESLADPGKRDFLVLDALDDRSLVPEPGQYLSALASIAFLERLARGEDRLAALRDGAKRIELDLPIAAEDVRRAEPRAARADPEALAARAATGWPSGAVVMGVIDDGIAFAHERFRTAARGTRFEAFWNQDGDLPSPGVLYGSELLRADIDALLGNRVAGLTEEDAIYRQSGYARFSRLIHKSVAYRAAHGTHVLDLAAGEDPARAPADRPIVGVQLRVGATALQSGKGLDWHVKRAVDYILLRALWLTPPGATPLPVVINFSYATHHGPHDGTSALEEAIEQRIDRARRRFGQEVRMVLPAGNTHLARCHASVGLGSGAVTLGLRLQPDDRTLSSMTFWLPSSGGAPPGSSRVVLRITAPDGQTGTLHEGAGPPLVLSRNGQPFCTVTYAFVPVSTRRGCFQVDLMPTARLGPTAPSALADRVAPAGLWTIRLEPENAGLGAGERIEAWIARDDLRFNYPRLGRQPYFEQPCYRRFDELGREPTDPPLPPCEVRRAGMISGLATGHLPIVVGGMQRKELRVAPYSAGGPVVTPEGGPSRADERKPDILLVSDDSKVHAGVIAAGARSGSFVAISGTSVAAPQIARWVADEIAAGRPGRRNNAIAEAELEEASIPKPPAPPLPPERGGHGRAPRISTQNWVGRRISS